MSDTIIMKFGGAAVATTEKFSHIADLIIQKKSFYKKIVIVVSAMGETTNQLIAMAKEVNPNPPQREYDMLISVGERISISLLAMALVKKNIEAISFTGSQSGIITCGNHANAQIVNVRPQRISECLDHGKVVIVAGFQGVSTQKEITTLGRGGSDTTAVALGIALGAGRIEFYKDVPGVFNDDPKKNSAAVQYEQLSYLQALEIVSKGARILHPRAIQLAQKNSMPLHVTSFIDVVKNSGTLIIDQQTKKPSTAIYELSIDLVRN